MYGHAVSYMGRGRAHAESACAPGARPSMAHTYPPIFNGRGVFPLLTVNPAAMSAHADDSCRVVSAYASSAQPASNVPAASDSVYSTNSIAKTRPRMPGPRRCCRMASEWIHSVLLPVKSGEARAGGTGACARGTQAQQQHVRAKFGSCTSAARARAQ